MSWVDARRGHVNWTYLLLGGRLVAKLVPSSCLSFVWICHPVINDSGQNTLLSGLPRVRVLWVPLGRLLGRAPTCPLRHVLANFPPLRLPYLVAAAPSFRRHVSNVLRASLQGEGYPPFYCIRLTTSPAIVSVFVDCFLNSALVLRLDLFPPDEMGPGYFVASVNMELNRAQLLVSDDRALEKFKATHGIPADVTIERPGPNDILHVVVERLDRIPVSVNFVRTVFAVDTLMNILDKPFSASDLFHIYTVVRPKESGNHFYSGNHYLRLRDPSQSRRDWSSVTRKRICFWTNLSGFRAPGSSILGMTAFGRSLGTTEVCPTFNDKFKFRSDACKEAIRATNNMQESRDVEALLEYEPHYRHKIPHRTVEFIRASLPPLRIEGRAPQREAFSPEVSGREEGYAASSSGYSSPNRIDDKEEEEAFGQLVLNKR
ncbi:hypothetical protein Acr_22g0002480 [Actinidia rufa]|uniref:Uncharacterized protein n=1 Tax=Actinidia rufa TaxID=165716 RepID=A0A7J0GJ63_9ERIC|nr:hypothetical protein Acr_22g0002480 [Actinidia rufa]